MLHVDMNGYKKFNLVEIVNKTFASKIVQQSEYHNTLKNVTCPLTSIKGEVKIFYGCKC